MRTPIPNYIAVPAGTQTRALVIPSGDWLDASNSETINSHLATLAGQDGEQYILAGITNLNYTFTVNSGVFRGAGDFFQIRKPTHIEASFEMTRFIVDNATWKLSAQSGSKKGGLVHLIHSHDYRPSLILLLTYVSGGGVTLQIHGLFGVHRADISVERQRVQENIAGRTVSNIMLGTKV